MSESRLCSWCSRPSTGRDEQGDPACSHCTSEAAAITAREARVARASNVIHVPAAFWRDRQISGFVRAEFRAFGAAI